ncbi:MAG: ABC transporter permease, partial [Candidatus Promineifilaceae bacterium]
VDPRIRVGGQDDQALVDSNDESWRAWRPSLPQWGLLWQDTPRQLRQAWRQSGDLLRSLLAYRTATVGLLIILGLGVTAVYTVVALPYGEAIALWRGEGSAYARNPRNALPIWTNWLRREPLPPSLALSSTGAGVVREVLPIDETITEVRMTFPIPYRYVDFPQDLVLDFSAEFTEKPPHVIVSWIDADGESAEITTLTPRQSQAYFVSQDERLMRRLDSEFPHVALFSDPASGALRQGDYALEVSAFLFETDSNLEADLTLMGKVHGWAGTDAVRRDLMVAVQWGTVIALAFGLVAVVTTSLFSMVLGAVAAWYGGTVDRIIQFLTETNLILPFFPISLMVFTLYSKSIWAILGVTILLNIFNDSVKLYRATFLQVKQAPYVVGAIAYGASNRRIVTQYLLPRISSLLIPKLVILVPSFVFLEATLAFLGLSDPTLPTWGKLVVTALSEGVYGSSGHIVWIPFGLLFLTGFAFAMVGFALERIVDPKLR